MKLRAPGRRTGRHISEDMRREIERAVNRPGALTVEIKPEGGKLTILQMEKKKIS